MLVAFESHNLVASARSKSMRSMPIRGAFLGTRVLKHRSYQEISRLRRFFFGPRNEAQRMRFTVLNRQRQRAPTAYRLAIETRWDLRFSKRLSVGDTAATGCSIGHDFADNRHGVQAYRPCLSLGAESLQCAMYFPFRAPLLRPRTAVGRSVCAHEHLA